MEKGWTRCEERKPRIPYRAPSAVAARETPPDEAKMITPLPMKIVRKMLQTWICSSCGLRRGYMDPGVSQDATAHLECKSCGKTRLHHNTWRNDTYDIELRT